MTEIELIPEEPRMSPYVITPLTRESALLILNWRYQAPYDIYDPTPQDLALFQNPVYRYHQVLDQEGRLAGYCCFGEDARVPGGDYTLGEPEVMDVGVGFKPELTGQGLGKGFVGAILDFAEVKFHPRRLRVTVASFNQRSLRTFLGLGFVPCGTFLRDLVPLEFTLLERPVRRDFHG